MPLGDLGLHGATRGLQEGVHQRSRVVVGRALGDAHELLEAAGFEGVLGEQVLADADEPAGDAPEVQVVFFLLGADADTEAPDAVDEDGGEEERGGDHVVLVDRKAPGAVVPTRRAL